MVVPPLGYSVGVHVDTNSLHTSCLVSSLSDPNIVIVILKDYLKMKLGLRKTLAAWFKGKGNMNETKSSLEQTRSSKDDEKIENLHKIVPLKKKM